MALRDVARKDAHRRAQVGNLKLVEAECWDLLDPRTIYMQAMTTPTTSIRHSDEHLLVLDYIYIHILIHSKLLI